MLTKKLIDEVATARKSVVDVMTQTRSLIDDLWAKYPDEPWLTAPLARSALAQAHAFNSIAKSLGMPGDPLALSAAGTEMRSMYFALGKSVQKSPPKPTPRRRMKHVYKLVQIAENAKPAERERLAAGESRGLDLYQEALRIDGGMMSATAVICTPAVDNDSEIIMPGGIDIESRYRANPVVLWEHGAEPALPTPIAKCEHPDGTLALEQSAEELVGTSYFTPHNQCSEQIFALIDEGIVRATSVRVDPDPDAMTYKKIDDKNVLVMKRSTLIEWSWCCMGVNPEAVRKTLDRNSLAGSKIAQPLKHVLKRYSAVSSREQKSQ